VDDAACVRRFEAASDLRDDGERLVRRERPSAQDFAERLAFQKLSDRVPDTVVAAEVVNRQDVRM